MLHATTSSAVARFADNGRRCKQAGQSEHELSNAQVLFFFCCGSEAVAAAALSASAPLRASINVINSKHEHRAAPDALRAARDAARPLVAAATAALIAFPTRLPAIRIRQRA